MTHDEMRSPADEINERLGFDADVTDPSQYCRHGTFIGSWWGPDYMCHMCEMGYECCEGDGCSNWVGHEEWEDWPEAFPPVEGKYLCRRCLLRHYGLQDRPFIDDVDWVGYFADRFESALSETTRAGFGLDFARHQLRHYGFARTRDMIASIVFELSKIEGKA